MNTREIFLVVAFILFLFLAFSSIKVVMGCHLKIGLKRSERLRLYSISIIIPLPGFILTRSLAGKLKD